MENKKRTVGIIIIVVTIGIVAMIFTLSAILKTEKENPEDWVLHSYGNNVALYRGEEIIEVYGSIMLDTLPEEDKKMLDNGIRFTTKDEAVTAIEDYDG